MSTTTQNVYIPGVCNIGPAEIRSRRQSGILGLIVTVVFIAVVLVFNVPWPWRLFVIIPAALGATGFLQAGLHFCVAFGTKGLFNVDKALGQTEAVHEVEYRRKDQRKAIIIVLGSAGIAIVIAVLTALLP